MQYSCSTPHVQTTLKQCPDVHIAAQTSDRPAEPPTTRLPPAFPLPALLRRSSDVGGQPGECRAAGTPVDRGLPPQAHLLQHNAGEWQGTYTFARHSSASLPPSRFASLRRSCHPQPPPKPRRASLPFRRSYPRNHLTSSPTWRKLFSPPPRLIHSCPPAPPPRIPWFPPPRSSCSTWTSRSASHSTRWRSRV